MVGHPDRIQGLQLAGIEAAHLLAFSLIDEQIVRSMAMERPYRGLFANQQNTSTKAISPTPGNGK